MADQPVRRSRRDLLKVVGAASAAAIAASVAKVVPADAAQGDPLTAGGTFTAALPLDITNSSAAGTGLIVEGNWTGIKGISPEGAAIVGIVADPTIARDVGAPRAGGYFDVESPSPSTGVMAMVSNGVGVDGYSVGGRRVGVLGHTMGEANVDGKGGVGVAGISDDVLPDDITDVGVYGLGSAGRPTGIGVFGQSPSGAGVVGVSRYGVYGTGDAGVVGDVYPGGVGVCGHVGANEPNFPAGSIGTYASAPSTAHTALYVGGKAHFTRSGKVTIGAGKSSYTKTLAGVTSKSLVIATLQSYRTGVYVAAAIPTTGKFKVRLNKAVSASTVVAYFVLD